MSQPKIAIVHYQTYPEIRVVKFADTLAAAGMDVVVVARDVVPGSDSRSKHPYAVAEGSETSSVRTRSVAQPDRRGGVRRALSTPYPFSPLWRSTITDVLDDGAELIIARDFHLAPAVISLAHARGVPVLLDIAENYPALLRLWRGQEGIGRGAMNAVIRNVTLARMVERHGVRRADQVTVVVPEHIERMHALGARDVLTIENTPVLKDLLAGIRPEPRPERPLHVVYTGEIHLYRGIDTVIDAVALINRQAAQRVTVSLVGTGKLIEPLRQRAHDAGVAADVRFLGWQPDLRPYMADADIGLVPPHSSEHQDMTMPNKLYDFMAFGKPVLVSDAAPMRRVVTESDAGLVFRAGDPHALAAGLLQLTDSALRSRLGINAARAVRDKYNWEVDGTKLTSVVRRMLGRRHPGNAQPEGVESTS